MKRKLLFILTAVIFNFSLQAQQNDLIEVFGKVINANTFRPVPYAFVVNTKRHLGTKTDTSGRFRIIMTWGDTLRISSLGFQTIYWAPKKEDIIRNRVNTVIYIPEISYKIGKVDIYAERWKAFVADVSNTEVKEDETQKRIILWISKVLEKEHLKTLANLSRGTGVIIPLPLKSKRERELRRLERIKQREQLQKEIDKKFNKELVAQITGLKGDELDYFMKNYCNFDREFILETSEYDLIMIIKDIYSEYEQLKKQKSAKQKQ